MSRLSRCRSGRPPSSLPSAPSGAQSDPLPTDPPGAAPPSRRREPACVDRHPHQGRAGRFLSACTRRVWARPLLAVIALVAVFALPGGIAQADTLVSNIGQSTSTHTGTVSSPTSQAQAFSTGSTVGGYGLGSVEVQVSSFSGTTSHISVSIYSEDGGDPDSVVHALSNPATISSGTQTFTAPANALLDASTTYYVVISSTSSSINISRTTSSSEDMGGATGWSIANSRTFGSSTSWATSANALKIRVKGTAVAVDSVELTSDPGTDETYARYFSNLITPDVVEVTVTFDGAVDITGTPQLELDFAGTPKAADCAAHGTDTTKLVCSYTVAENDSAPNGIAIAANKLTLNGGTIKLSGSTTSDAVLTHGAVAIDSGHKVDGIRPTLVTTGNDAPKTSEDGTQVVLTFSEDVVAATTSNISLSVNSTPGFAASATVTVSGRTVTLTLLAVFTLEHGQAVEVGMSTGVIHDTAGNRNPRVVGQTVTNNVPAPPAAITGVAITSDPGADQNYTTGGDIEVTATFDQAVTVTGKPRILLRLETVTRGDRWAEYARGSGGTEIVFAYTVLATDESDNNGIRIGHPGQTNNVDLNGGTVTVVATGENASLSYVPLLADSGHRVNWARPSLSSAKTSTDGTKVLLTFSEHLDEASSVAANLFTVKVDGTALMLSGSAAVSDSVVTLTLATALTSSTQAVTVSYADPTTGDDASAIEDLVGNDADSFSDQTVTNRFGTTTAPTVSGVALTSAPGTDNTYAIADSVVATVTFDAAVDITAAAQLELDFDGTAKAAACATGTNTTTMACSYTVLVGDSAPDGVAIAADKLTGGTIYATGVTTATADLDHVAVAIDADHKVDGIRPTLVTTGTDAPTTSTDGAKVILTFDEDLGSVTRSLITIQANSSTVTTTLASIVGSTKVELTLTTALTAAATNLTVALAADAVDDAIGNGNLALAATGVTNAVGTTTAPTVTGIALTSSPTHAAYGRTEDVEATVTFDAAVDITGTPQLELDFDGTAKAAACATATNTTTMVCSYRVATGDSAPNGIAIAANKLTGGTITATGSTTAADLDHGAVAIDADHKVDGIRPTLVTTGAGAPTTSTDGTKVYLTFSEDIRPVNRNLITIEANGVTQSTTAADRTGNKAEITLATALTAAATNLTVALASNSVFDAAGNGILAVAATAVTNAVDAPDPPGTLKARRGDGEVHLEWAPAAAVPGDPDLAYQLRYGADGGESGQWRDIPRSAPGGPNARSYTVTGLENGTRYAFELRVRRRGGGLGTAAEIRQTPEAPRWSVSTNRRSVDEGEDVTLSIATRNAVGFYSAPEPLTLAVIGRIVLESKTIKGAEPEDYEIRVGGATVRGYPKDITFLNFDSDPDREPFPAQHFDVEVPAGSTALNVTVRVLADDDDEEGQEHMSFMVFRGEELVNEHTWDGTGVNIESGDAGVVKQLAVADAEATEGEDPSLDFVVTLAPAAAWTVTVDYATHDGTARAGSDYTDTSGTLTFAPGDTEKTVSVPVVDDTVEDTPETLTLRLSNADPEYTDSGNDVVWGSREHGVLIADAVATGTIRNTEDAADLSADFPESAFASKRHTGSDDRPQVVVAFTQAVAEFAANTPSVSVTGASGLSVQPHAEDGIENAYIFFMTPDGDGDVTFALTANAACAAGGICTAGGTVLTQVPAAWTIPGPSENTAPAGLPEISGTAEVGETLTASVAGIADADGTDNAAFAYQWLAHDGTDDTAIAGATNDAYAVAAEDAGKTLKVRATFTDDKGTEEVLVSAATETVVDRRPVAATLSVGAGAAEAGRFRLGIAFGDAVTGLALADLAASRVGGGTAAVSELAEAETGRAWTAWVAAEAGRYTVRLAAGAAEAGERRSLAAVLAVNVDADGNARAVAGPVVTAVALATEPDGTWTAGETVRLSLGFSEPVTVASDGGAPTVGIGLDGTARRAAYAGGTGRLAVFAYRVTADDGTVSAVTVTADSLAMNGGTIRDAAGRDADLEHPGIGGATEETETESAPALTGLKLVDTGTGTETALADGAALVLDDPANGGWGLTASVAAEAQVGSVVLALTGAKTVSVTDDSAPFSLHGDEDGTVKGAALPAGSYTLKATAHAEAGGAGAALGTLSVSFTVAAGEAVAPDALTASFEGVPEAHGGPGSEAFTFRVRFSLEPRVSYKVLRDESFAVTGGGVRKARRVDGRNDLREIHVEPEGWDDVRVMLAGGRACGTEGAVCTADGKVLANTAVATVPGPLALSVADARVDEAPGAVLAFEVTLNRAAAGTVTVDYATADGTATAGADYTATSGMLTFAPGETAKTVNVPVLDDAHDDTGETLTLTLSNASGARIRDGEATGTIENSDAIPKAWLARFGRTVADHVVDAVTERLTGSSGGGSQVTLGGQPIPLDGVLNGASARTSPVGTAGGDARESAAAADTLAAFADRISGGSNERGTAWARWGEGGGEDAATGRESRGLTERELLPGSSFVLSLGGAEANGSGTAWTAWGRAAASRFDGEADGLSLDGDVTTFTFGADAARGRWLGGVALAHSTGEGGYRDHDDSGDPNHRGRGSGTLESSLTSVHPYARLAVSERLSLWGILGYGTGDLTLTVDAAGNRPRQTWQTETEMQMAAAGARGVLLSAADHDGFELAARGDARLVRMFSDAATGADGAGRLSESESETSRQRFILEGSHRIEMAGGQALTPSLEVGLRHDGGDAETGTGIEVGGGVSYADPATGLTVEGKARGLVAHEDADYTEWGASASVRLNPGAAGRGLSLSLSPAWGADSGNAERLWGLGDARGLAANDGFEPAGRLDAEAGWGFGAFGGRGLATPFAGLSLSDAGERTWRSGVRWTLGPDTAFGVEGRLREAANDNEAEHGIGFKLTARW